jgi:DNA-binding response OmpR family regulator
VTTVQHSSDQPTPTILVVDDEDYVADMIATGLRLEGYAVQVAYNGRQGLELARGAGFALVIIDLMMPYISGEQLAIQLRDQPHLARVPIILISAGARPRRLLPGIVFISKPFDLDQMLATAGAKLHAGAHPGEDLAAAETG